jgi:hypothetical protein
MKRRGFFSFLAGLVAAPVVAKVVPAPVVADPTAGGYDLAVHRYWTSSPYGAAQLARVAAYQEAAYALKPLHVVGTVLSTTDP